MPLGVHAAPNFFYFSIVFCAVACQICQKSCSSEKSSRFSESNPTQKKRVMKSFQLDKSLIFYLYIAAGAKKTTKL